MTAITRDDFLAAAADDDGSNFVAIISKQHSKDDSFDLDELITSLSKKQMEDLWDNLLRKCTSALLNFDDVEEAELLSSSNSNIHAAMIQSIVTVAGSTIADNHVTIPQGLFETAVVLHGIILSLPDGNEKLVNSISCLCESWWLRDLEGRNEVISQTLVHLVQRCLKPSVTNTDIKRLWKIHDSISVIDFGNERSAALKILFQQAMASRSFLKCPEGRKFLAYLFTLNVDMIDSLHSAMKVTIAVSSKSSLDWIGEVYFRAWSGASDSVLELLAYFHKQKKQKGVDDMLQRLYGPILWRSLKVASSKVRANAASLLLDAFPLQSTLCGVEETEELLRKQFESIEHLLSDPCHSVRAIVAHGVCRISAVYWEFIPKETIRLLLGIVVQKLAWDSSNADVRHAVIKGLDFMVDYRLTHSFLNSVLPKLCSLFHDKTEKVRLAVADLLLKIKRLQVIKFWQLVPVEQILARLEVDSPAVAKRIVELLTDSYFPESKPLDGQFSRAVQLIKTNRGAARKFYLYAFNYVNSVSSVKFIMYVMTCLGEIARQHEAQNGSVENELSKSDCEPLPEATDDAENAVETANSVSDMDFIAEDFNLVSGLLECVVILWMGIQPSINKPSAAQMKKVLELRVSKQLPVIFRNFEDSQIIGPLMVIAGFLPPSAVPLVSCGLLSKLKALANYGSESTDFGPLLSTMCKWRKGNELLELITELLEPCIVPSALVNSRRSSRGTRTVMFNVSEKPCPLQALRYLEHLLTNAPCRCTLLENNRLALRALAQCLKNVTVKVEQRITSGASPNAALTDDVMIKIFENYLKLEVILNAKEKPHDSAVAALEHQLTWIDSQLVSYLGPMQVAGALPQKKRMRRLLTAANCTLMSETLNEMQSISMYDVSVVTARAEPSADTKTFVKNMIEKAILIATDMLLIGMADSELVARFGDFTISVLRLGEGISFLPVILSLMYRIAELYALGNSGRGLETDEGVGSHDDPLPRLLSEVLTVLSSFNQTQKTSAEKLLSDIRQPLAEVFSSFFRYTESSSCSVVDVMSSATAAIVTDVVNFVHCREDVSQHAGLLELPRLSAFIVSTLMKQHARTIALFLNEIELVCQSSVCESAEGLLACLYLVNHIASGKNGEATIIRKCLLELSEKIALVTIADDASGDSRDLLTRTQDLLKSCCERMQISR